MNENLQKARRRAVASIALCVLGFAVFAIPPALADPDKVRLLSSSDEPDPFSPAIVDEQKDTNTLTLELAVRKTDGLRALEQQAGPADDKLFLVRWSWEIYLPPPEGEEPQEITVAVLEQEFSIEPPFETLFLPLERGNAEGEFVRVVVENSWDGTDVDGEPVPDGVYLYRFSAEIVRVDTLGNGNTQEKLLGELASGEETPGEVRVDNSPPQITATLTPSPNAAGWNHTDVTVSFECADEVGFEECPEPVLVSGDCVEEEVSGSVTDLAGNTTTVTVTVRIDKLPPSIAGAFDLPPNANGWNNTPLTATFESADSCSGVAELTPPVLLGAEGANQQATGTAVDLAGNAASLTLVASIDLTPPTIAATADPPANAAGWNDTAVTVSFDCADALSGVESCSEPVTLAGEGAEQAAVGTVTDLAGNVASATALVSIDLTPPAITATADPPANAAGWNNTPVVVSFDCTDALSGVSSCSETVILSGEGADQEVTGTVTDQAGNSATATAAASIDLTPPAITATADPPANAAGWNNTAVTVTFACEDGLSGVVSCPEPVVLAGEGAAQAAVGTVTDQAGSSASATVLVSIDLTPPVITATADPPANAAGWNNTAVTVTFDCQDTLSGVASCSGPVALSSEGAAQEAAGTVTDLAGNAAGATALVSIDLTPPAIAAAANPPANAAGWNNSDVTVSFDCQDALSGVASCSAPVTLSSEGAGQVVNGTALDAADNSASASATVSIDKTPPAFDAAEFQPALCPELTLELQPRVRACFADGLSGVAGGTVELSVDGVDRTSAAVIEGTCIAWDPPDAFDPGEHQATIAATDQAGNAGSAPWCFEVASPALAIAVDSPVSGLVTRDDTVVVTGTVDALADTVEVGGVVAAVAGGGFEAVGVPLREGKNVLTAVARNAFGGIGTASVTVVRDTTPPAVRIETPRDGAVLTSLQADVAGLVNDLITGTTINADDCQVSVNGIEAEVANRSFLLPDLLLKRGVNTLVAEARDRTGNVATFSIQVTVQDQAGQRIRLLAGNNQSGDVFEELADPLIVVLEDANGDPVPGRPVTFTVSRGDGTLRAFPQAGTTVTVVSDDFGQASARFELGGRSGAGNNRVLTTASGFLGEVELCATAATGVAARITTLAGDRQRGGVVEQPLPSPLVVLVTDAGGNPVGGVDVTFEVVQGGGSFDGSLASFSTTDLDGLAEVAWTLGPDEGINNNGAQASFGGLAEAGAIFTASARRIGRPADTRISGLVLDNQDLPVPGATVSVETTSLTTLSDDQGQFTIAGAPVGSLRLLFDGTTTTRPGRWPRLEFDLTTISGRDNTLDRPVYLLPLASAAVVGGGEDVTLFLDEVPGAELTVFADSVTCPDGSPTCEVSVTQVRSERVPMDPPLGSSFMLAWTIQPAGTRFNPPARLCIPNADQLPGQQVEIYSFDHDQGEFIAVGTATVAADGSQICSDPGFGVVKAGWHGCVPPPPPCVPGGAGSCDDNDDNVCTEKRRVSRDCGFDCEPVDTDGRSCEPDDEKCEVNGMCEGGSCTGERKEITSVTAKADGDEDLALQALNEGDPPPTVSFSVDVESENCDDLTYEWDFGDGGTSTAESPSHEYMAAGRFEVKVTVECDECEEATQDDTVEVIVVSAEVSDADVTQDRIVVMLEPPGVSGELTLELREPNNHTIRAEPRSGGQHTETFDIPNLAIGDYTKVRATWAVEESGQMAEARGELDYHIQVLGEYRHSQYNTPAESQCAGPAATAYITEEGATGVSQCFNTPPGNFTVTTLQQQFISQVSLNGSGTSTNFGDVQVDFFCPNTAAAPAGAGGRTFRQRTIEPACAGLGLGNDTVARRPGHPDLGCGDQIFIHNVGTKTVTDACPGCPNGLTAGEVGQLDNFTIDGRCTGITDLIRNAMTIKIFP